MDKLVDLGHPTTSKMLSMVKQGRPNFTVVRPQPLLVPGAVERVNNVKIILAPVTALLDGFCRRTGTKAFEVLEELSSCRDQVIQAIAAVQSVTRGRQEQYLDAVDNVNSILVVIQLRALHFDGDLLNRGSFEDTRDIIEDPYHIDGGRTCVLQCDCGLDVRGYVGLESGLVIPLLKNRIQHS